MKPTSAVALMIGMWMLSGWGWGATQAAEPSLGSSFKQWCQQQASLSAEARKTVEVLLEEAGTRDCERAAKDLLSRTRLFLENDQITDISPLSGLTNLTELYLNFSPITVEEGEEVSVFSKTHGTDGRVWHEIGTNQWVAWVRSDFVCQSSNEF